MQIKKITAALAAFAAAVTLSGCAAAGVKGREEAQCAQEVREAENPAEIPEEAQAPEVAEPPETPVPVGGAIPAKKTVTYVCVTADGVNIRSGAGSGYTALGTAEKKTLYAYLGEVNGWYKTQYKNKTAYISSKFCVLTDMDESGDSRIEAVIAEGAKLLGAPYVYGAVRFHDGKGNKLKNFTVNAFDCSSLMQYIFYKGADKLIEVNTRTQIYQGATVNKSQLKRGDLMFFTNSSRKNYTGIERVGHVAIYLGDNYILHTASDYAKIEQITPLRWSYFIQGQRIL